jgi:hypothetical protein
MIGRGSHVKTGGDYPVLSRRHVVAVSTKQPRMMRAQQSPSQQQQQRNNHFGEFDDDLGLQGFLGRPTQSERRTIFHPDGKRALC